MGIFDTQDNSKIMPAGSTTSGYGGQLFTANSGGHNAAALSYFDDHGVVTDPVTGYTGSPREIAQRYINDRRDLTTLQNRFGK